MLEMKLSGEDSIEHSLALPKVIIIYIASSASIIMAKEYRKYYRANMYTHAG